MVHLARVAEVIQVHEPALPALDPRQVARARDTRGGPFGALRRSERGMDDQSKGCLNLFLFWVIVLLLGFSIAIVVALVRAG